MIISYVCLQHLSNFRTAFVLSFKLFFYRIFSLFSINNLDIHSKIVSTFCPLNALASTYYNPNEAAFSYA